MITRILQLLTPPVIPAIGRRLGILSTPGKIIRYPKNENDSQDLDMYFDPEYAKILDNWGADNTWIEIQMLLCNCEGKVLDIACGTGVTISILGKYPKLEVHGCDISDLLIAKAAERGIPKDRLAVTDATQMSYPNDSFDYSYSIGSLEHFTTNGIDKFIAEASRITRKCSMHMIPTSKSGQNEGWMTTSTTIQTFHNNSDAWWLERFKRHFREVHILNSRWNDGISFGRWFVCKR
ncbi:MAG TPA: class I SAM-dependent methyltransferase [Bacteroidia bacterium]|nr:class I SAM-dependent methyltransferase [Bacteroidia bacterium]